MNFFVQKFITAEKIRMCLLLEFRNLESFLRKISVRKGIHNTASLKMLSELVMIFLIQYYHTQNIAVRNYTVLSQSRNNKTKRF